MPNDCVNIITVTCEDSEEFGRVCEELRSAPDTEEVQCGDKGMMVNRWSGWRPVNPWLEGLLERHPNVWIKNEWWEEGGQAGVWIGYRENQEKVIRELEWKDLSIEERYYFFETTKNKPKESSSSSSSSLSVKERVQERMKNDRQNGTNSYSEMAMDTCSLEERQLRSEELEYMNKQRRFKN